MIITASLNEASFFGLAKQYVRENIIALENSNSRTDLELARIYRLVEEENRPNAVIRTAT